MKSTSSIIITAIAIPFLLVVGFNIPYGAEAKKLRGESHRHGRQHQPGGQRRNLQAPNLVIIGNNDPNMPLLGRCEGECDADSDCQPGLICFQRQINEPVPFCSGIDDTSKGDYCTVVDNTDAPTFFPTSPPTMAPTIECPQNVSTFIAYTAILFDANLSSRPDPLLSVAEQQVLNSEFINVYNTVSGENCDESFRRLTAVSFLSQKIVSDGGISRQRRDRRRNHRRELQAVGVNTNTTTIVATDFVYQVQGTCRNCPVDPAGSFRLFDDAFRRRLETSFEQALLQIIDTTFPQECSCLAELVSETGEELQRRPPEAQDCVNTLNNRFQNLGQDPSSGLFQGVVATGIEQIEEPTPEPTWAPTPEPTPVPTWAPTTAEPSQEPSKAPKDKKDKNN